MSHLPRGGEGGHPILISPKKDEIKQLSMVACVRLLLIVTS